MSILEGLLTLRALVLLGACVDHLMKAKCVFAFELFATGGTAVGSLLSVYHHVAAQLHRALAGLIAQLALEAHRLLLVTHAVVFQRLLQPKTTPTLLTAEGLGRSLLVA